MLTMSSTLVWFAKLVAMMQRAERLWRGACDDDQPSLGRDCPPFSCVVGQRERKVGGVQAVRLCRDLANAHAHPWRHTHRSTRSCNSGRSRRGRGLVTITQSIVRKPAATALCPCRSTGSTGAISGAFQEVFESWWTSNAKYLQDAHL
jgi:hypothetical protein